MGLWSSMVDGAWSIGTELSNGVNWIWDNSSLTNVSTGIANYTVNTSFNLIEQTLALRKAIPDLLNHTPSRKIVDSMNDIVVKDLLPLATINFVNNGVQSYFRSGQLETMSWLSPYSAFLMALTLADYGVRAYTLRQGVELIIHSSVVDILGPSAFNATKKTPSPTLCTEEQCSTKRIIKGGAREPLIFIANDAFAGIVSYIPYIGGPLGKLLSIYFAGRYITRVVTPERCERHKAMDSTSVLALGLGHEFVGTLMDKFFESTVGMPSFLYYRTFRHFLLLLYINLAAHMELPLVSKKSTTVSLDPLDLYEGATRFLIDVQFAGLMKTVPIYFKLEEGTEPLINLQSCTKLLNSDLEKEQIIEPTLLNTAFKHLKVWVLPPILRSTKEFTHDPIIRRFWPDIREGMIFSLDVVQSVGRYKKTTATIAWAPKSVATALYYIAGVPKIITKEILMLTKEKDFWDLVSALKLWFERHNLEYEVALVSKPPKLLLFGDKLLEPVPVNNVSTEIPKALELIPQKQVEEVVAPELLIVKRPVVEISDNPEGFFSTRRRNNQKEDEKNKIENPNKKKEAKIKFVENYFN